MYCLDCFHLVQPCDYPRYRLHRSFRIILAIGFHLLVLWYGDPSICVRPNVSRTQGSINLYVEVGLSPIKNSANYLLLPCGLPYSCLLCCYCVYWCITVFIAPYLLLLSHIFDGMAEALAVIGLVSAIVQFVEFGSKIISRVSEFQTGVNDVPKSFRDIMVELPLLLDTLKRTKEQVEDGQVDENTQKALLPVVNGCQSQVELLNDILVKMLPSVGDSSWKRGIKAFSSVRQERKVEQITKTFHNYIQTLTYYEVTGHIKSKAKLMKPFFMVPFERDPKYITRADIASQISQRLGTHNRVALAGLGGVG